ncbi:MAG: hypothetical protein KKF67_03085 [Nanoarchaeota archaeon]|nr:hypothetical protein [Nanoarchaeota archaeon]
MKNQIKNQEVVLGKTNTEISGFNIFSSKNHIPNFPEAIWKKGKCGVFFWKNSGD